MPVTMTETPTLLRKQLRKKDLKPIDLAYKLHLSEVYINKILSGERSGGPHRQTILDMLDIEEIKPETKLRLKRSKA